VSDEITKEDKIKCLRRELALRTHVYPRWIEKGQMTKEKAAREIELIRAIISDYEELLK
jgi:hypothetical protein